MLRLREFYNSDFEFYLAIDKEMDELSIMDTASYREDIQDVYTVMQRFDESLPDILLTEDMSGNYTVKAIFRWLEHMMQSHAYSKLS
jgi:hypothetical protein